MTRLAGEVFGTFLLRWEDQRIWGGDDSQAGYLHHWAFRAEWRGRGLGTALLNWVDQKVSLEGRECIRLDCVANNEKLNQIYLANGFELVKQIEYSDGEPGNLYEKVCQVKRESAV